MKPRNRKQSEMVERFMARGFYQSDDIPLPVGRWANKTLIPRQIMASGHKAWCTDCGHPFAYELPKGKRTRYAVCPHCGKRLPVTASRKKEFYENGFFQQLDTDGELQIISMYEWEYSAHEGREGSVWLKHVYDLWLTEGFRERWRFSVPMKMFYYRFKDPFGYGPLELRNDNLYFRSDPARDWHINGVYPRRKLQPWLEKYDIRPPFTGTDIYGTVMHLMSDTKDETVWKLRRWNPALAKYYFRHGYNTERFFRQVCLAHKHDYKIKDPAMWFDHLELLSGENKDIHNPHYIFPADLAAEHQTLIDRRERKRQEEERRREEQRKLREEKERLERENANSESNMKYRSRYGRALDVVVTKGDIEIRPLQNVQDFFEQGKELHQCVYGAKYYDKPGSICLCVKIAGVRTETVEVSLGSRKIVQCRGAFDQDSKRHAEILALATKTKNKFINAVPTRASKQQAS